MTILRKFSQFVCKNIRILHLEEVLPTSINMFLWQNKKNIIAELSQNTPPNQVLW